jgi:aromatic ring-opening dioxygenase catalytic subunit (LigB family)
MTPGLPAFYVPHGGGPCFFMADPDDTWSGMAAFLRGLPATLPVTPRAILVVSGHWETPGLTLTGSVAPPLVYDYYGFPPDTYQLRYPAPGDPALAGEVAALLKEQGFEAGLDPARGLDHGVFVPLKVVYPEASIPVVELSLDARLDPAYHLAVGRALRGLRERGVLLFCAGMSFHNLRALGDPRALAPSMAFDTWLGESCALPGAQRAQQLAQWERAPAARICHPRPEHLLPLMVAAGSSDAPGQRIYNERVLGTMISGFRFD